MEELEKGINISMSGDTANRAIDRALAQISSWGLTMPKVDPLVLDFGLGRFDEIGEIEFWIANEVAAGYCGKFLFVFDGQLCPLHMHKNKLETFFVVRGTLDVTYAGDAIELPQGGVLEVRTGVEHSFAGIGPALLLEVSAPSIIDDNYFADRSIPIGGNYEGRR